MKTLAAATLFALALPASATIYYEFDGDCFDGCSGTAIGKFVMKESYVQGDAVYCTFLHPTQPGLQCNIAEFRWTDSADSFVVSNARIPGTLVNWFAPVDLPGPANLLMNPLNFTPQEGTFSTSSAMWRMSVEVAPLEPKHVAWGTSHSWHTYAVPEPNSLALLFVAIAGWWSLIRWRKVT